MRRQARLHETGIMGVLMRTKPTLAIVIPCFNEEETLPLMLPRFLAKLDRLMHENRVAEDSFLMLVDDGSEDSTWDIISALARHNSHVRGIRQSRNRGHQNAVLAGLMEVKDRCDASISIDCDGQDDVDAMDEMISRYREGFDVVYGVRGNRRTDAWFKRTTARAFYRLLGWLGAEVVYDHADYRLLSAPVMKELSGFREVNIYLRGMVPLVGFKSCEVVYERSKRIAGRSRYSLMRMIGLALDGVTSLTIKPIRLVMALGVVISVASFFGIVWAVANVVMGWAVSGWASTISVICLLGGVQLICLGVIGEYVGKTYLETKARPRYIISERTSFEGDGSSRPAQVAPTDAGESVRGDVRGGNAWQTGRE